MGACCPHPVGLGFDRSRHVVNGQAHGICTWRLRRTFGHLVARGAAPAARSTGPSRGSSRGCRPRAHDVGLRHRAGTRRVRPASRAHPDRPGRGWHGCSVGREPDRSRCCLARRGTIGQRPGVSFATASRGALVRNRPAEATRDTFVRRGGGGLVATGRVPHPQEPEESVLEPPSSSASPEHPVQDEWRSGVLLSHGSVSPSCACSADQTRAD